MHRYNFTTALAKFICIFALVAWTPSAKAVDYAVTVTRDASNYYAGNFAFSSVIKTQSCFEFAFSENATLRLLTPSTGTLFFSSGAQCTVVNVFDPATVAAGNYAVFVNSNVDGYYELTDGSYLIKASGFDSAFGSSATLALTSAVNGFASGTITVANSFPRQLSNIYGSRQSTALLNQTIAFGAQGGQNFISGGTFSINPATASSGLAVSYAASPASVCTMSSGTTVNMIDAGNCTITASQAGNANYNAAASVSQTAAIAWGVFHSCAVVNGGVQCWGFNGNGELGNNSTAQSLFPVQAIAAGSSVTAVSVGLYHACAVVGGGVQCWGYNGTGQLGNNSTANSLQPVQVIASASNVTGISAGRYHTCAVVNGGVQCWGYNGNGQLGNNSIAQSLFPVQTIPVGNNATAVSAGSYHSCAVVNGGVQCWGYNGSGQLGNNSTAQSLFPVQTVTAGNATAVSAAMYHTCAAVNGGAQCWGFNGNGQLGNNSTAQSLIPVQAIAASANVTAVATGLYHACAVVNGGVQCWGYNGNGQLGNNSTTQSPVPVQTITTGSSVTVLSAGHYHTCAVANNGVKCWGFNANGQLGNSSTAQSLVPVVAIVGVVPPQNQTITFGPQAGQTYVNGGTFTINPFATASSGLAISYAVSPVGVCTMGNGITVNMIGAGTCTITASQTGNSAYNAATPISQAVAIAKVSQSITFGSVTDKTLVQSPVVLGAAASSNLVVSYSTTTSSVCSVTSNIVTLLTAGLCSITASQTGDGNFNAATPVSQSFNVTKANQAITFGAQAGQTYVIGGSFTISPVATTTSPLNITYTVAPASLCTMGSGTIVNMLGAGTCTVTASQAGDATYNAASPVSQMVIIAGANQTVVFVPVLTVTVGVAPITLTATASSGLTAFTFSTSSSANICTVSGNKLTIVGLGTCSLTAAQPGNATFASAAANADVNVVINQPVVTFIGVQSRKQHGTLGPYDVLIDTNALLAGGVSVEPRISGTGHRVVFQFSGPVNTIGLTSAIDAQSNSYSAAPTISGSEVTITLTGVPDNKRVTVSLDGVNGSLNQFVSIGFLLGDVNSSHSINASDIASVKAHVGQTTDLTNFIFDLNANGTISASDVSVVKARSGLVLP